MHKDNLPRHIAIIMDGNGRWAKARGLERIQGHTEGVVTSEKIITHASKRGLQYLTLYAFSHENWNRPPEEVGALMGLLKAFLLDKRQKMLDNGIRLQAIGDLDLLPGEVRTTLESVMRDTCQGQGMVLTLALSYGSRNEILRAIHKLIHECLNRGEFKGDISEEEFGHLLDTAGVPDPDLIIRTSGEQRISNFLLWQGAYAEFVFEDVNWPDFTPQHLEKAISDYFQRERRFGKTSEQLTKEY